MLFLLLAFVKNKNKNKKFFFRLCSPMEMSICWKAKMNSLFFFLF